MADLLATTRQADRIRNQESSTSTTGMERIVFPHMPAEFQTIHLALYNQVSEPYPRSPNPVSS